MAKEAGTTPSGIPLPPVQLPLSGPPSPRPLESVTKGGAPPWTPSPRPEQRPAPAKG